MQYYCSKQISNGDWMFSKHKEENGKLSDALLLCSDGVSNIASKTTPVSPTRNTMNLPVHISALNITLYTIVTYASSYNETYKKTNEMWCIL